LTAIFNGVLSGVLFGVASTAGLHFNMWQYWVVLLCVVLIIINSMLDF
jgi:hypothetical protein